MNRPPGSARNGQENSPDDAEVRAATIAIAGLRWRLRRDGVLRHPDVLRELRKFDQDVSAQMEEQAGGSPGRHRSAARRKRGQAAGPGPLDLKPDPRLARTPVELIQALRDYRAWSGYPTWRTIAAKAGQTRVHSTIWAAMHSDGLPKLDVVRAIIIGCGGSQHDLAAFTAAWHRIRSGTASGQPPGAGFHAAPTLACWLSPGSQPSLSVTHPSARWDDPEAMTAPSGRGSWEIAAR